MSKKNTKSETIRFRTTAEFVELLKKKMRSAKISSYSEFLRKSVKDSNIIENCEDIKKIRYEINKIGVNLNQLTKYVHQTGKIDHLAYKEIEEISLNLTYLLEALYNDVD